MLLWSAAAVGVVVLGLARLVPTHDYLYVPNSAHPVAAKVKVEGEKPPAAGDEGAIYYVDVTVRRATWMERLLPFTRPDGATIVPEEQVVPHGSSFEERHEDGLREMVRSEEVASAVALKEAGFDVEGDPARRARRGRRDGRARSGRARCGRRDRGCARPRHEDPGGSCAGSSRTSSPATRVALRVRRDGKVSTVTVRTVESPSEAGRAIIGIRVAQAADVKLPVKVDIDLGDVGGPSAGLPLALDVLQELGTDVDGGRRVVATGEIALDGTIGPIGGVKQKTFGARRAGADVFLVPAGENAAEARRYAGNLRIIPVREFSTGVVRPAYASREIAFLQAFCRDGQQALIAGLSSPAPCEPPGTWPQCPLSGRRHVCSMGNTLHAC